MGKKIALIDSERGSASKYADRFDFDVVDLVKKTVDEYCNFIDEAAAAGYEVLVIDSLTHAWQTLNEEVEKIANARYRGNFWAAWNEGTPMQRRLVNSLLSYPGHIIATMRSKTEWKTSSEDNKSKITYIGLAPEQGKGIEYEFDILFQISIEHLATILKDRTGKFQSRIIEKPDKSFGEELVAWLNEGVVTIDMQIQEVMKEIGNILKSKNEKSVPYFTDKEYDSVRLMCRDSINDPKERRLEYLQSLLNEWKNCLHFRVSQEAAPPKPAAPVVPDKPVATQTTTTQTQSVQAKPAAGNQERSIKADFEKMIQDKNQQSETEPDMPSMYSEQEEILSYEPDPNEFEDDIPDGRETVAASASFEDIF
jgi:hypothetical protein